MSMDGSCAGNAHAIYFSSNDKLVLNGSYLAITNYAQDALEWNGGGYNILLNSSTFYSDHNRSGFTGTLVVKADNSRIDVVNSTGNGSNGKPVLVNGEVALETLHAFGEFRVVSQEDNLITLEDCTIAITNDPEINAVIKKVWVDSGDTTKRTDSVKVNLLANGKVLKAYELSAKNGWSVSVTLPKYDENGKEIKYIPVETTRVEGYFVSYGDGGFTVYNTLASLKPQTGDDSDVAFWALLMGFGAVTVLRKRSKA